MNVYYQKICLSLAFTDASKFFNATLVDFNGAHDWVVVDVIFDAEWMFSLNLRTFVHCIDEVAEAIHEILMGKKMTLSDNSIYCDNFSKFPILSVPLV